MWRRNLRRISRRRRRGNRRRPDRKQQLSASAAHIGRAGRRVLPAVALMAVACGLPALVFQGYRYTVNSPYFSVAQVEISGAEALSHQELLEHADLKLPINAFDLDPPMLAARLEQHPWVARAEVERRLPRHLIVEIEEHQPAAVLLGDGGEMWLLDEEGHPFKELEASDQRAELLRQLPLISGLSVEVLSRGQKDALEQVSQALEVGRLYRKLGLDTYAPLGEIHADPVLGLSLVVGSQGAEVRLGKGRYRERLERFSAVWARLGDRGIAPQEVAYVLVDDPGEALARVVVGRGGGGGTPAR